MANPEMVSKLYDALCDAMSKVSDEHAFTRGDAMSAAIHLIVNTGLSNPDDTTERLTREVHAALKSCIEAFRQTATN